MNLSCDCNPGSICGTRDAVISVAYEVNSLHRDFAGVDFKANGKGQNFVKSNFESICKHRLYERVDFVPDDEGCFLSTIN